MELIDKAALAANIEARYNECLKRAKIVDAEYWNGKADAYRDMLVILDTFEVKDDSLENFKSLQHISGDLKSTLQDWGYAPNLYFCDGMWHVSWISCEEGDSIKDFEGNTPEEAIDKACNWFHSTFCNS